MEAVLPRIQTDMLKSLFIWEKSIKKPAAFGAILFAQTL
jgi:hypothetical protein